MNRNDIIRMAWKAGFERLGHTNNDWVCYPEDIERFAALVASAERGACAEICDGFYLSWVDIQGRYEFMGEGASECAGAIRARGNRSE